MKLTLKFWIIWNWGQTLELQVSGIVIIVGTLGREEG